MTPTLAEDMIGVFALLGLGIIEWKADTDRHDNKVSLITLPDNMKFRMVHHVSKGTYEYATIYAGRNKFMRYKYRCTESDMQANSVTLGKFGLSWGDGDNLGGDVDLSIPVPVQVEIKSVLRQIDENGSEQGFFILNVLLRASSFDSIWESK